MALLGRLEGWARGRLVSAGGAAWKGRGDWVFREKCLKGVCFLPKVSLRHGNPAG